MKRFVYFQPNKKDLKDRYADCTIRALCKALDVSWLEAFDLTIPICRREQVSNLFDAPASVRHAFLAELGFGYTPISNKRGSTRPTISEFAKDHPTGRHIVVVAHHVVAVVDGMYYDTWDSGRRTLYGFYTKQ